MSAHLNFSINTPIRSDNSEDIEEMVRKMTTQMDLSGIWAAAILFPVSTILALSNQAGSSTSLWGIAWKTVAFVGFCALGYQFKLNYKQRESIRKEVKEIARLSQIEKSKPIVVFVNSQELPALLPCMFYDAYYKEQIEKLSKIARVYILEPIHELSLLDLLKQFKSKSIKTMCIRTHANNFRMKISPGLILTNKHTNIINKINDKMTKYSHIILLGCNTAKGQENISKDFSSICTKSTIYGSKSYSTMIGSQINIDGSNKIVFLPKGGSVKNPIENIARKYNNGHIVD